MADTQRQPARKGPHQAWDIKEDSAYEPRLWRGLLLWGLGRLRAPQSVVDQHAKPHFFPPESAGPRSPIMPWAAPIMFVQCASLA
jgi:hypothetical protein